MHNFKIANMDTDSIMIYKDNGEAFSESEQKELLEQINSQLPKLIKLDHDGYFKKVIILRAKNYILDDGVKVKYKGSALKDTKKEPALKEMQKKLLEAILKDEESTLVDIYHSYIKELYSIEDINRWAVKRTITKSVLENDRKNESKVRDALDIENYQEGDKVWLICDIQGEEPILKKGEPQFYSDGRAKMQPKQVLLTPENYRGSIDVDHYLNRIYNTVCILENVVDMSKFPDYTLKRNKALLQELLYS